MEDLSYDAKTKKTLRNTFCNMGVIVRLLRFPYYKSGRVYRLKLHFGSEHLADSSCENSRELLKCLAEN